MNLLIMKKLLIFFTFLCCLIGSPHLISAEKKKSYKPKTVHVRSYTTKKGKHVRSHKRSKPTTYIIPKVRKNGWAA